MQVQQSGLEMEFREKLELALSPKIEALRKELSACSLSEILERYQFRIHLAKHDKSNVPDSFIFKWRYLWSQALQCSIFDRSCNLKPNFVRIDALLEEIFKSAKPSRQCQVRTGN